MSSIYTEICIRVCMYLNTFGNTDFLNLTTTKSLIAQQSWFYENTPGEASFLTQILHSVGASS